MKIVEVSRRGFTIDGIIDSEVRARNFGGVEKKVGNRTVNTEGRRNFLLYVSDEVAEQLKEMGCEVRYTTPRDENDIPRPFVSMNLSYYLKPVEVHMIANGVDTPLDENHVYQLNDVDFKNLGLVVELGKEKEHQNGVKYIPLFISQVWAEIVPSYFANRYSYLNNQAPELETTPF